MTNEFHFLNRDRFFRRIFMSLAGVLVSGFAVGLIKRSALGVDPFTILVCGCDAVIPISYGLVYIVINALLLIFSIFLDRSKIGFATFVNLFLLGYVVDFTEKLMIKLFPAINPAGQAAFVITGIVILCLASALYFTADMGVSTYDAVALVLSQRIKKLPFRLWRILTDIVCLISGCTLFILGKESFFSVFLILGIGSVVTAFFMGPLISFFRKHVSEPLLYGKDGNFSEI